MLQYLGIIEQRTTEILQAYAASQIGLPNEHTLQLPSVVPAEGTGKVLPAIIPSYEDMSSGEDSEGEKDERAHFLSAIVINGGFYLPFGAEFIEKWIKEFRAFPRGRHDDQVDTAVHGANFLLNAATVSVWSPVELGRIGGFDEIRHSLESRGIWVMAA